MAHFAKLDDNNIVIDVHVLDNSVLMDSEGVETESRGINYLNKIHKHSNWKQTSYNTSHGVHKLGGTPFRKNYAGIGYTYDAVKDAFISPQPYPSWTLDETSATWDAPITYPSVTTYFRDPSKPALYYFIDWDEDNQRWIALDGEEPNGEFVWNVETDSWDSINT